MVNTFGGKKHKKGKKGGRGTKNPTKLFDTGNGIFYYAQVKSKLGGNTLDVLLQTGESVHATIPGRFLRKVWFNKDDLIVVSNETDNYYDVIQKITNPAIQAEAMTALNIKLDKDNSQLFRTDIDEIEDEDEDEDENENEDEDEKEVSKAKLNALRKKKDKERDLQRREGNDEDREISVVTKNRNGCDNDDDDDDDDKSKSGSTKSGSTKSSSTKSSSTKSALSTDSAEEDIGLPQPEVTKKKVVHTQHTRVTHDTKVTPDKIKKENVEVKPTTSKKVIQYTETPEEVAKMLGL